jgi:probable rRNA maturation factor
MATPTPARARRGGAATEARTLNGEVLVLNRQRRRRVSEERLRGVVERAAAALSAGKGDVAIVISRDALLRRLNRSYRKKDAATDVLSFGSARAAGSLGDIVISVDAAERNAASEGHSLTEELEILVLHGWLHLLGYDHERDRGTMKRLEQRLRRRVLRETGRRA